MHRPHVLYVIRMNIAVRHLRALVALADHGTHTAAAAALGVTQPTLTRTVRQLERLCGDRLLEARTAAFTPRGTEVLARARRVVDECDALTADLAAHPVVRVGFAWLLPDRWYGRTRGDVESQHAVSVQLCRVDDPLAALGAGEVDIAVYRNRPPQLPAGTSTRLLGTEQRVLAISRNDEVSAMPVAQWEFLPARPVVVNTVSGSTAADSLPRDGANRSVISCRNFDEWLELVAAGKGIGVVPELAARRVAHPDVAFIPITGAPPTPVRLAWRERPPPVRAVNAFLAVAFSHGHEIAGDPPPRATR